MAHRPRLAGTSCRRRSHIAHRSPRGASADIVWLEAVWHPLRDEALMGSTQDAGLRVSCPRSLATALDEASTAGHLFAGSAFLFGELRRQRLAEIGHLVNRPDFDLARAGHRVGAALRPFDRLGHVLDLPEPETGDQFAGC